MTKKTRAKARRVLFTLSLVLVVAFAAVGGTIAWLQDSTLTIQNTFTPTGINIELIETPNVDTNDDGKPDAWTAELVPGKVYKKDPVVKVVREDVKDEKGNLVLRGTDVDVYLFVKFEEEGSPSTYLSYTSTLTAENSGWTKVENTDNVYYRTVLATDNNPEWHLLDGDKVTVKSTLTKEDMIKVPNDVYLKYTAYAIQKDNLTDSNGNVVNTPAGAWAIVSKN